MRILVLLLLLFQFPGGVNAEKLPKGRISNLSEPNKFFTGRKSEISAVSDSLVRNNTLVIEGVSGIGKTQLAKQYAHTHLKDYNLIWWFDSEKNMDTQTDELLKEIFRRENKPYYRPATSLGLAHKVKEALALLKASWLIILDNIEDMGTIDSYLPLKNTHSFSKHVIVTSKKMNETYPSLNMSKFQRADSIDFLAKILDGESKESLNQLAEALGDFPLALAQAAGYIKMNPSINVKTYLELFKEGHSELWNSEEKLEKEDQFSLSLSVKDNYRKTIGTAIKLNIASIKERSPLAYDLLRFSSLLYHQHIPLEVLEAWACDKQGASKLEFHEALSLLLNYFVLEKEKRDGENNNLEFFNQHELIQLIVADTVNDDTKKRILEGAADSFLQKLVYSSETLYEQFKEKEHFYNHMEKLCQLAATMNHDDNMTLLELRIAVLYFIHFIQHDFDRATALIQPLKSLVKNHRQLSPLGQIWFACIIVNDRMFENLSEVEQSYRQGLKFLEDIKDKETKIGYLLHLNIDYVESLSNFGKIKEALSICDSLEDTLKTTENKAEKIAFLSISALVRLKYGQYEHALKDAEDCLELIPKQKGAESYIPFLMVTKANSLLYLGQIEQAYQLIEKYYPSLLEVYSSPDCIVLVRAQLIKAACMASFKKEDDAIKLLQKTLNPYEKTSGFGNDSLKGMGYRILGEIYEAKEDHATAYEKYVKAENFYDAILQEKTLDELGLLYMRLAILGAKLGDDLMVKKYLGLHMENFGLAHPRTFEIKKFLDEKGLSLL